MALSGMLLAEKDEIAPMVREKRQIGEKLISAAGCKDFTPMLGLCRKLCDKVDEVSDMVSKKGGYAHAGFQSQAKFSRKFHRKGKELLDFEMEIAGEFEAKRISLEHGRGMVSAVKFLKSEETGKARGAAEEFYGLLKMGNRLEVINESLSKKRLQIGRARRGIEEQLSDLEWLEKEPPPDTEKVERHEERMRLLEEMQKMRLERITALERMPAIQMLDEMRKYGLSGLGFPEISADDAGSLKAFLRTSGLAPKTARELLEMAGRNEERLRHELPDLQGFRREIIGRRAFLSELSGLDTREFLSLGKYGEAALGYLSAHNEEAANAASRLSGLEKTAGQDAAEWERRQKIESKKAELNCVEKSGLTRSLQELERLRRILDGGEDSEVRKPEPKKTGLLDSILGIFR